MASLRIRDTLLGLRLDAGDERGWKMNICDDITDTAPGVVESVGASTTYSAVGIPMLQRW